MVDTVQEKGFSDRSKTNYSEKMYWVVTSEGTTATLELNGSTNFGRKHLLLPSLKADKLKDKKTKEDFDAYVTQKNINRATHRSKAEHYASPSTDLQKTKTRWKDKYHSGTSKNTVINLVTSSQNSIDSKSAALAFFKAVSGEKWSNGETKPINVDFGRVCVLSHNKKGEKLGDSSKVEVLVKCTGDGSYEVVHME